MNRLLLVAVAGMLSGASPSAHSLPPRGVRALVTDTIPLADRLRLADAFRLAATLGDSVWTGWSRAPFAVLLVTADREFLLRHPNPSPDFTRTGYDSLLAADVFVRPRTMPTSLLATFPVLDATPVIVIGEAEHTDRRPTSWVLTVLHEHFHQLQMSSPQYQQRLAALDLAKGDESGSWALNYAFPYALPMVETRMHDLMRALLATDGAQALRVRAARNAHDTLRASLSAADARYLSFQCWQEGVARYTELRMAQLASLRFTPSAALRAQAGFTSFAAEADSLQTGIGRGAASRLAEVQRSAFYPLGAAQALFLDRARPDWKSGYLRGPLSLDAPMEALNTRR